MNDDRLQYAELVELLIDGPIGGRRYWAAMLVVRMLETKGGCHYRSDDRLGGVAHAQTAIASLRAAVRVLSESEQGLLLRTVLTLPWEQLRRDTGLSLRVPEILAELGQDLGISLCLAAAQSVVEHGHDAVRLYPLEGLLPEVRQPGEGLVFTFDARDRRQLGISAAQIEIDRLAVAVQSFRGWGWESNLRPLVAWRLAALESREAEDAVRRLLLDFRAAARDDQARWRSLGLLDWMIAHPHHPAASTALAAGREVARADVRKAAADLATVLGRWDVLASLARDDADKGVRHRAGRLLAGRSGQGAPGGQGELFG